MAIESKHRHPVKAEDGSWMCDTCGAESFDLDDFEAAAEWMECLGPIPGTEQKKLEPVVAQIEAAKEAAKKMTIQMQVSAENLDRIRIAMGQMGKAASSLSSKYMQPFVTSERTRMDGRTEYEVVDPKTGDWSYYVSRVPKTVNKW